MRILLTIILLFAYSVGFAEKVDTVGLSKAFYALNDALVNKDSIMLKKLLHKKVHYGHSNGWIETKQEVIDDLFNGRLVYNKLTQDDVTVVVVNGTACIRSKANIDVALNGNGLKMTLHVLQVWIKETQRWQLLSRQSTKIN